jgi:Spy/CpxP family protein refolding chaperone
MKEMQMRNRNLIVTGAVLILITLVAPVYAQHGSRPNPSGPAPGMQPPAPSQQEEAMGAGLPLGPVMHCLKVVGLSDDQKTAIKAAVDAEAPKLQALHEQAKTDREALKALVDATTQDPCAIGTAFLKVRADEVAIHTELESFRTTIESILTPEQKLKLAGCLEAGPGPGR